MIKRKRRKKCPLLCNFCAREDSLERVKGRVRLRGQGEVGRMR